MTTTVAESSSRASSGQPARCGITNCCSGEVMRKTAAIVSSVIRQRGPGWGPRVKKLSRPATRAYRASSTMSSTCASAERRSDDRSQAARESSSTKR